MFVSSEIDHLKWACYTPSPLLSVLLLRCYLIKSNLANEYTYISSGVMGVFTLLDTETDIETVEKNCVDVFILRSDGRQHRFSLGSVLMY